MIPLCFLTSSHYLPLKLHFSIPAFPPRTTMTSSPSSEKASLSDTEAQPPKPEPSALQPVSSLSPAPDGGLQAWLVASGGFSIAFCCLGFVNSFGTFEEYYLNHQLRGQSPDDVAWIGSVAAFLQFAVGAFAGPLFDRYGAWVC